MNTKTNLRPGFFQILGVIAVLTISFHSTNLSAEENYQSFIKKGDKYYEQFENLRALKEYEKAYELKPDSFEALMKLTRAYNDVGEDLKGIKLDRDKERKSDEVKKYFEKAAEHSKILKEKFPDKYESYFLSAVAFGNLALFEGG